MPIVGSDRIATRARFTWPALRWESVGADDRACMLCAQVRNAQEALSQLDPYPAPGPQPLPSFAPWQPGPGLFIPDEQ